MPPESRRKSRRKRISAVILAALLTIGLGLAALWLIERGRLVPRNVVLIVIDTLRADHLGAYGYVRPTSPFLDEVAAKGVLFENAVSAAPATFPSVNTLLTSQSPSLFYKVNAHDLGIPGELTTLAEVFHGAGFRTVAVSASPIIRGSPSGRSKPLGFEQGFEQFDGSCLGQKNKVRAFSAHCVTDRALQFLPSLAADRFFLYLHYLDPHSPYRPPRGASSFGQPYRGKKFIETGKPDPIAAWLYLGKPDPKVGNSEIQHLLDLYDGEIRAVDEDLRRLVDGFARHGVLDDTLFIFISDHGESFMEHGHMAHGQNVYQQTLHVPLIFHWPRRWQTGIRRPETVCTIDVMPTILALANLPIPEAARGVPLLESQAGLGKPHLCQTEGRPDWRSRSGLLVSLRIGMDKIIFERRRNLYEIYDLSADPNELNDLADSGASTESPRNTALKRALHAWIQPGATSDERPVILDAEAKSALRALGYIE